MFADVIVKVPSIRAEVMLRVPNLNDGWLKSESGKSKLTGIWKDRPRETLIKFSLSTGSIDKVVAA
jgi:hypothetical protein